MGIGKWMARKGAVGGAARQVANAFWLAFNQDLIDADGLEDGSTTMADEIAKVADIAIKARLSGDDSHPDYSSEIQEFSVAPHQCLIGATIGILKIEAELHKNTTDVCEMFIEVIEEELQKKGVGPAFIFGGNDADPETVRADLLEWSRQNPH